MFNYLFPGFAAWMPLIGPTMGLVGSLFGGNSQGSGGGAASGGAPQYVPTNLAGADNGWQDAYNASGRLAHDAQNNAQAGINNSLDLGQHINYGGYQNAANQAGGMYGQAGDLANQQMGQYGQQAQGALNQQNSLYGYGQQVMNTGFDPQHALYDRTSQQLQDQVRSGQAARGLGNSQAGDALENGAMGNFNIDWQNAQLGRQTQALGANVNASNAGVAQGRMYGADQSAALAAGAQAAGYYQQAGAAPVAAAQYIAQQPGQVASQYTQQLGGLQQMYGNQQSSAIPYMNNGQGAQKNNYDANTAQNAAQNKGLTDFANAIGPSVSKWFSGGSGGTQGGQYNNASAYGGGQQPYMVDENNYTPNYG